MTALVRGLGERLAPYVHVFSNEVETMPRIDVSEGHLLTTGGTDFDCVVSHALAQRWRRILVITDGYAGLDSGLTGRALAEGLEAYVVLCGAHVTARHGLEPLTRGCWRYPETPGRDGDEIPF